MAERELLRTLRGRLLVAAPSLGDSNFFRTVVLMLEHSGGTLGLVLNRPTSVPLADAAPDWAPLAGDPPVVFFGGPVDRTSAIGLARCDPATDAELVTPLYDDIAVVDLSRGPGALAGNVEGLRIFSGYAGWTEGQLEAEIEAGGWFVLDRGAFDSLTRQPAVLWFDGLRRAAANGPYGNSAVLSGDN